MIQARQTAFNDWLTKARTDYKVVTYDVWKNLVPTESGGINHSAAVRSKNPS